MPRPARTPTKPKKAAPAKVAAAPEYPRNHDRYVVPGLQRGIEALHLFNRSTREMTLTAIGEALSLSRSAAFRLLYTLEFLGLVERDPVHKTYRLTTKVLSLGFEYLASLDVVEISRPYLETLRDETGASSHLAIREGHDIIYVARVPTRHPMTSTAVLGGKRPAHATSMGRVLLSELPEDEIRALYRATPLKAYTEQTPTSIDALLAVLKQDRARGCVVSRGSFEQGGSSIAAPIRNARGEIVAAIEIAGPNSAFDLSKLETQLKDSVCKTAQLISGRMS